MNAFLYSLLKGGLYSMSGKAKVIHVTHSPVTSKEMIERQDNDTLDT